jgi:FixJ family two-component response regulator
MPVKGGSSFEAYEISCPGLPVILASGDDVPQAVSRLGEHKLADFISKPFILDSLLSTVKFVIQRRVVPATEEPFLTAAKNGCLSRNEA